MPIRVIQGFFVGGRIPAAITGAPRPVAQPKPASGTFQSRPMPGPPPAAFGGPLHTMQAHPAPGRPPSPHGAAASPVQRQGADCFPVDPVQLGLARGGGALLPHPLLAKMEAAFQADFSTVRVHVGPQAARIGAIAFTTGNDIYFAPGRYQPDSVQGQQLIGHELAHVVQQRQGRVRMAGSGVAVVQDHALEAEADRLGMRAAMHRAPLQPKAASPAMPAAGQAILRAGDQSYRKWQNRAPKRRTGPRKAKWLRELEAALPPKPVVPRPRHGFDMLAMPEAKFRIAFEKVAGGKIPDEMMMGEYEAYKVYERGARLGLPIRMLKDFRVSTAIEDRTAELAEMEGYFDALSGFKRRKPDQLRSLLLGSYLKDPAAPSNLRNFVEDAGGEKEERRRQKWLRISDALWTGEINARWVQAGIKRKYPFKIISPMPAAMQNWVIGKIRRQVSGPAFLSSVRDKYYRHQNPTRNSHNLLWKDVDPTPGEHGPSFLAYEIAELLEAKYVLDEAYLRAKNVIKLVPPVAAVIL